MLFPQVDGERTTWWLRRWRRRDRACGIISQYGPQAVALYASGQLLTEELLRLPIS